MTRLTRTTVDHSQIGEMETVSFTTDVGAVNLTVSDDGSVTLEIGYEEVSADEMADLLNDVADDEHMDSDALEVAFEMVAEASDESDGSDENDKDETDVEAGTGTVVHTLDDCTEVRVGDRVNHRDGSTYKITGRASEHTLSKTDLSDDSEITIRMLEEDIRERGFAERVDV